MKKKILIIAIAAATLTVLLVSILLLLISSGSRVSDKELTTSYAQKVEEFYHQNNSYPLLLSDLPGITTEVLKERRIYYEVVDRDGVWHRSNRGDQSTAKTLNICSYRIYVQKTSFGLNPRATAVRANSKC